MKNPLVQREQAFIKHKEDILVLHGGREWSGFDGFVETVLLKLDCQLVRVRFCTSPPHGDLIDR